MSTLQGSNIEVIQHLQSSSCFRRVLFDEQDFLNHILPGIFLTLKPSSVKVDFLNYQSYENGQILGSLRNDLLLVSYICTLPPIHTTSV